MELSQRLLQLERKCLRQTQGRPAPIPAGKREIPERPLPAQQALSADLADLDF
jgi:hypothetical protein